MTIERLDVEFESCGATLRGWLYRPDGDREVPGIVMAHGLSAVKEMFLDRYAAVFADAGFATLVYDHYGFGASGGEPRQSPSATLQLQGYRDGINWLAARVDVDAGRVGIWGSSLSGGEVITLAAEPLPIACAVAQVPFLGEGAPELPGGAVLAVQRAIERGDDAAILGAVTDDPDGDGIMFADSAHEWFMRAARSAPRWRNEVLIAGMFDASARTPVADLARARVPLRLIVATEDGLTPPALALALADQLANVDIVEIDGGHFDVYETGFDTSSALARDWFISHLSR